MRATKRDCNHRYELVPHAGGDYFPGGHYNMRCRRCGHRRVKLGPGFSVKAFIAGRRQRG